MDKDRQKRVFILVYHILTLVCLGLFAVALRHAYLYVNVSSALWVLLYIVIAVYLIGTVVFIVRSRGVNRSIIYTIALQLVPICATIFTFCVVDNSDDYTPIGGKVNTYERSFNDMQDRQKAAALANGLAPFRSRAEIEEDFGKLRLTRKLVRIESNPKYVVRELSSSSPYVVPKVRDLLDDIAVRFQEKTQSKARFIVTSVLRTEEDVKKLRKTNVNASTNSCHCNATTIDISYVRFSPDKVKPRSNYELRLALAQTLHELRKEGRCYVKIERKQYCYHITVR